MSDPEYRKLDDALQILDEVVKKMGSCTCKETEEGYCARCLVMEAEDIVDRTLSTLPPVPGEHVSRLLLCEASMLVLRPNTFYYFTIAPDCESCLKTAEAYKDFPTPHKGSETHVVKSEDYGNNMYPERTC